MVVVGAGVAGLCCAYELGKAGYHVTIIEAAGRLGGRSWTIRGGAVHTDLRGETQECQFAPGRWLNAGPARIAQHHTTLDYCRELGVEVEVFVNANVDAYVERGGVVRRRRSAMADLDGYISELLAKCVDADVLDDELPAAERSALLAHLRAVGLLGRSDRGYDEPPGVGPGVVGAPDPLGLVLGLGVGERLAFERDWHQAMPMFHPVGGMDRILDALVDAIGADNVRAGRPVVSVRQRSDAVEVTVADGEVVAADWGIWCTQPAIGAALPNPWSSEVNRALAAPSAVPAAKIGLEYGRRFWEIEDRILGGTSTVSSDVRVIWYPSTGYLSAGGVIVGAYPIGSPAVTFDRMSPMEREALALASGVEFHGDSYRDELESSFSVSWESVEHVQGAWTTGLGRSDAETLLEPTGRWLFAGDWLSQTPGWQHGAFESARHAVALLHERALAE